MMLLRCLYCGLLAMLAFAGVTPAAAQTAMHNPAPGSTQVILHLLDYVGVNCQGAVEDGKIKSEDEFKEMLEFTGQAVEQMKALPANAQQAGLIGDAERFAATDRPPRRAALGARGLDRRARSGSRYLDRRDFPHQYQCYSSAAW